VDHPQSQGAQVRPTAHRCVSRSLNPRPELKLTSGKGIEDVTVPLAELIDAVVRSNTVVAFIKGTRTAPECGFSKRLLLNLEECGVAYEVVNVLDAVHNPGLREAIKQYSQWPTIPQLYAHGAFLGGADITGEMHEARGGGLCSGVPALTPFLQRGELKAALERRA